MDNELDAARELAELIKESDTHNFLSAESKREQAVMATPPDSKREINPGKPTQYALYGQGYMATTPTVPKLPSGCYDIYADSAGVYAVPALPPSGLLLDLPEMRSNDVIQVVESFLGSEKDYKDGNEFVIGGASFKTGIFIFGPPGSGKSCTIKIVSKKLVNEHNGIVFYGSSPPSMLTSFLTDFAKIEENRKSVVILEDFDGLVRNYGEAGYLEMLDSAKSINNVIFIATTNYPERLDPRIYNRPGRFSHVIKIGYPTPKTREAYLKAILKNHKDIDYIVSQTQGFTIDHLTALVNSHYREKKNLDREIERIKILFKMPKSEDKSIGIGANLHDWKE